MHFTSYTKMFSTKLVAVFVVSMMAVWMVSTGAEREQFNLNKLGEYNTLIDCFTTIKDDFTACNKKAVKRGEFVLKYVDENSSLATLLKCCGTWIVRDCWVAAAQERCADGAKDQLHNLPSKFMPAIQTMCEDYQPGSFYCFIPHLLVIGVFVTIALIIIIIVVTIVVVYRRRTRRGRRIVDSDSEKASNNNTEEKLTGDTT